MEKTNAIMLMMVSYLPSDLVMVRWVHFHSPRLGMIVAQVPQVN